MKSWYCEKAKRISERLNDIVIKAGEPTELYWHIHECDECEFNRYDPYEEDLRIEQSYMKEE